MRTLDHGWVGSIEVIGAQVTERVEIALRRTLTDILLQPRPKPARWSSVAALPQTVHNRRCGVTAPVRSTRTVADQAGLLSGGLVARRQSGRDTTSFVALWKRFEREIMILCFAPGSEL